MRCWKTCWCTCSSTPTNTISMPSMLVRPHESRRVRGGAGGGTKCGNEGMCEKRTHAGWRRRRGAQRRGLSQQFVKHSYFFGNPANFSYRTEFNLESDVLESDVQKRILMSVFFGIWRLFPNRTFGAARPGARQHRADLPPHAQALTTAHPCVFDILWCLLCL